MSFRRWYTWQNLLRDTFPTLRRQTKPKLSKSVSRELSKFMFAWKTTCLLGFPAILDLIFISTLVTNPSPNVSCGTFMQDSTISRLFRGRWSEPLISCCDAQSERPVTPINEASIPSFHPISPSSISIKNNISAFHSITFTSRRSCSLLYILFSNHKNFSLFNNQTKKTNQPTNQSRCSSPSPRLSPSLFLQLQLLLTARLLLQLVTRVAMVLLLVSKVL